MTGGIRGIVEPSPTDSLGYPVVNYSGLYDDSLIFQVNIEDLPHQSGDNQNTVPTGKAPPDKPVPAPRAMKGIARSHIFTTSATCSVVLGSTTTQLGVGDS